MFPSCCTSLTAERYGYVAHLTKMTVKGDGSIIYSINDDESTANLG